MAGLGRVAQRYPQAVGLEVALVTTVRERSLHGYEDITPTRKRREPMTGPEKPKEKADVALKQLKAMRGEKDKEGLSAFFTVGPFMAQMADAASTQAAMKKGGVEGNPAMEPFADNTAALYLIKGGIGAAVGLGANKLAKDGHRGLGKALGLVGIVLPSAVAVHNLARK